VPDSTLDPDNPDVAAYIKDFQMDITDNIEDIWTPDIQFFG